MPTTQQMEGAILAAERLEAARYSPDGDYAHEDVNGTLTWEQMSENQMLFVLHTVVNFEGFTKDQELGFIQAVVENVDPAVLLAEPDADYDRWKAVEAGIAREAESSEARALLEPDPRVDAAEREIDAWYDDYERQGYRDVLTQECFDLNRDLGYAGFREQFFDDPDAAKEWPDPADREAGLRASWDSFADYDAYAKTMGGMSTEEMEAHQDALRETPKDGTYYREASGRGKEAKERDAYDRELDAVASRVPANDNPRGGPER